MARKKVEVAEVLPAGFTKRKNGTLQYRFCVEEKAYYVYGETITDCILKAEQKRQDADKNIQKRENPTLREYSERWQENRELHVSPATIRTQEHILRTICAVPVGSQKLPIGDLRLRKIKADDLEDLQRQLLEGWKPAEEKENPNAHKQPRKRTSQTVNDYMSLLGHLLRDAKKKDLIEKNPMEAITALKRTEERARDTIHRAWSQQEQAAFFASDLTRQSAYYRIFQIAALTGMRCGEIGALQHRDITRGFINVERTVTRRSAGYYIGSDAKTAAGRRKIPIDDQLKAVLTEQKRINRILYGEVAGPTDTIFKAPMGGLLLSTPADRELKGLCRKIGIPSITMHGLRATFATRCIEAGMNPRTLQELLGHENFNLTMSLYGHVVQDTLSSERAKVHIAI